MWNLMEDCDHYYMFDEFISFSSQNGSGITELENARLSFDFCINFFAVQIKIQ